jgi:signal transduction histidine kinase
MGSLRKRFLVGSGLWTLGLLLLAHLASSHLFRHAEFFLYLPEAPLVGIGLLAMACGLLLVLRTLAPISELRRRLLKVRQGQAERVAGRYASEVQPLVDDLNALLDHRSAVVARALAKAGDLAHGLKTPLALLAQTAEKAANQGDLALATTIAQLGEKMNRQVDYHLAQARAAAAGATLGARCDVRPAVEGLVATLRQLYAERDLVFEVVIPTVCAVKTQREDLEEMLGNVLDNACKWTRTRVRVCAEHHGDLVEIVVEDDGPGLASEKCEAVLERGVRADQAAPGSGLGLAIVRDLAELYGGAITLGRASSGGLCARLSLPASAAELKTFDRRDQEATNDHRRNA